MNDQQQIRSDALTDEQIREIAEKHFWGGHLTTVDDLEKAIRAALRAASPVEPPAAAPIDTPTDREFALSAAICVHPKGVYGDEGGSMCCPITHTRDASFAPAPADERAAFESLKGAWQSMPPFDVFCAGWRAARAQGGEKFRYCSVCCCKRWFTDAGDCVVCIGLFNDAYGTNHEDHR